MNDQTRHPAWRHRASLLAFALMAALAAPAYADTADRGFRVAATSRVGGEGSWDYLDYQASTGRLFIARVGGVLVLDSRTMAPVGSIPANAGTRVHGVTFAEDLGLGLTSDGGDKTATVFDGRSLQVLRHVPLGAAPDGIVYDPTSHAGVAFDGDGNAAIAFDPAKGQVVARIELPGSPEGAVADGLGHIYVNLSDKNEIASLDTHSWKLEGHWPIGGGCTEPTPLALSAAAKTLLVGCRSGILAVYDVARHAAVATMPIGKGADGIAFEPSTGLIFVSCYDGTLAIAKAEASGLYLPVQTVATAKGARTMALDPTGLRAFLPVADLGPMLPKTDDVPSRPAIIPETFRILTVAR